MPKHDEPGGIFPTNVAEVYYKMLKDSISIHSVELASIQCHSDCIGIGNFIGNSPESH